MTIKYKLPEPAPKPIPLMLQAAFVIETLAHLQGREELLPQAEHLRKSYDLLSAVKVVDITPEVYKTLKECLR